jgi:threonine dehydrogenase-like Zn-dependent dehydrogenase
LRGSQGDVDAFPDCIHLIASGKVDLKKIISHYIPLDQVEDGLKMMKDKNERVMKVIVRY